MAEKLIRKRGALKAKLTLFKKFIDSIGESPEVSNLEISNRVTALQQTYLEFNQVQTDIETLAADADKEFAVPEACLLEREAFENTYHTYLSIAQARATALVNPEVKFEPIHTVESLIKLPPINLPHFDGAFTTWLEFKAKFLAIIHNNPSLQDFQRFHYLKSVLSPKPAQLIASLDFTPSNYARAWSTLCERFDNDAQLINMHVKALFDLTSLQAITSQSLRKFIDDINIHLRSLAALNEPVSQWDTLLLYIFTNKFTSGLVQEWESFAHSRQGPTLEHLLKFLNDKADILAKVEALPKQLSVAAKSVKFSKSFVTTTSSSVTCPVCKGSHKLFNCDRFRSFSVRDRIARVSSLKLCHNCLQAGHFRQNCTASHCRTCGRDHNTLLHINILNPNNSKGYPTPPPSVSSAVNASEHNGEFKPPTVTLSSRASCKLGCVEVILPTAEVFIRAITNVNMSVRALLDSGSQSSFVTEDVCGQLGILPSPVRIEVMGMNGSVSCINKRVQLSIQNKYGTYERTMSCFVVPSITRQLPDSPIAVEQLGIPSNLDLADPNFNSPAPVGLLIGADLFWDTLIDQRVTLGRDKPMLHNTQFGWVISGMSTNLLGSTRCHLSRSGEVADLARFWELEEIETTTARSAEQVACEEHFQENTTRDLTGRFVVKLPFKGDPNSLGTSQARAVEQLIRMERYRVKTPIYNERYVQFMQEYEALNHMTKVESVKDAVGSYFIPHHGVMREDSSTTKLRVVFNASAPSSTQVSLNDLLMIGPTIQDALASILMRFRTWQWVVVGDLEKMYRQVLIHPSDRKWQQVVWRADTRSDIQSFELNTVTYGMASASFLAVRCLKALADEVACSQPEAARIIEHDFYVDDLITGLDDKNELIHRIKAVRDILRSGRFQLRKWNANSPDILAALNEESLECNMTISIPTPIPSVLGLTWDPQADQVIYHITPFEPQCATKRSVLAAVAKIFDPLGLLNPCIVIGKVIFQSLWALQIGWDDPLPASITAQWDSYLRSLSGLHEFRVPRLVLTSTSNPVEIHGFSDASERAYGACVYLRSHDCNGNTVIQLLCAKSKVAPLKSCTIPRLELCGAVLLTRLLATVRSAVNRSIKRSFCWTDSTVVLHWLNTSPHLLKPFVSHRVAEVQRDSAHSSWRHVASPDNPADFISRGTVPREIMDNSLWWHGPSWLSEPESRWPAVDIQVGPLLEARTQTKVCLVLTTETFIDKYSSLTRLERVVAYCLRFLSKCRKLPVNSTGLTRVELDTSHLYLIKHVQHHFFSSEIQKLRQGRSLDRSNQLFNLSPFLDNEGFLRLGGRLKNSLFQFDKIHPLILPKQSHFTKLLFQRMHKALLHAGPHLLLATIRERYWPIAGRNLAKATYRECMQCFKCGPKPILPIMGNLPTSRVTPALPFSLVGMDYCGPFLTKPRAGRGRTLHKTYVCVFICLVTKGLHLEAVCDLTTDAFLMALRRFVARRGLPSELFSDNGRNFVGAKNRLADLGRFLLAQATNIQSACVQERIQFNFIPAHSPHFGGLWEAGVKSFKTHFYKIAGQSNLTLEEFSTLLCQVESILNSRPLHALTDDPRDLQPLTPSHFLMGRTAAAVPERPIDPHTQLCALTHYERVQTLQQQFWRWWRRQYVAELQTRTKWKASTGSLSVNDLVLVKDDHVPPLCWPMGRVIQLHPGSDGVARVVTVRTAKGNIQRVVHKLCPLPRQCQPGTPSNICDV